MEHDPKRQSDPVDERNVNAVNFGFVLAFGVVFLGLCALFVVATRRPQSEPVAPVAQITFAPASDETPSPPPPPADIRGEALGYWKPAIGQAGAAGAAFKSARSHFDEGEEAAALHDLAVGQRAATGAFEAAAADPPEDEAWSTIQSYLVDGISIERDALAIARPAIQHGSHAEFQRAANADANARKAIGYATAAARSWYSRNGGDAAAIRDVDGKTPSPAPSPTAPPVSHS